MKRKVFKTGNSLVISLPKEAVEYLGVEVGDDVEIEFGIEEKSLVLIPAEKPLTVGGVDQDFARQVAEFIEQYRPALEALAKE